MNLFRRYRRSETEEIDRALNAYLMDASYPIENSEATQTLNTHRMAMSAIQSDPAATGPAAGTWNRVLRATATAQPKLKGCEEMTTATAYPGTPYRPVEDSGEQQRSLGRSSLSIAASVIVIVSIVFGGWFAIMNLPPDDSRHNLAMAPATPVVGQACDVQPLTADEAIAIAKNPFNAVEPTLYDMTGLYDRLSGEGYAVPNRPQMTLFYTSHPENDIDEQEWADVLELGNAYLDCIQSGTVGQAFALMDPFIVQNYLRDHLPLFMGEEETRAYLADLLQKEAIEFGWTDPDHLSYVSDKVLQINPEFWLIYADSRLAYRDRFYTEVIGAPVLFSDQDGSVASAPTFAGIPFGQMAGSTRFARNVFFVKSSFDGQWYVFGIFIP